VLKSTMILCLAAAASATAYAEPDSILQLQNSTGVSLKNVNFNRPNEVAGLYRRITWAADQVCGPSTMRGFHFTSPVYTRCYNKAVDDAVASVDRPELTAYYQERSVYSSRHLASQ
jgi:UrcA family protein